MRSLRKCLALTAVLAVLTSASAVALENTEASASAAKEREVESFLSAKKQSEEDRWWAVAAVNEWNLAIGRNWTAAKAYLDQQAQVRPQRAVHRASGGGTYHGNAAGSVNGYPCGGDLPPCYVLRRESGGNPGAENPVSSASGLWQFIDGTWNGFGGYSHASDAPPEVQNEKARLTWAGGAGAGHWACC